jgi:hypothetical protein
MSTPVYTGIVPEDLLSLLLRMNELNDDPNYIDLQNQLEDAEKDEVNSLVHQLHDLGFDFLATEGTSRSLEEAGIPNRLVKKIAEGRPNVTDRIKNGEVQLVINTPSGKVSAGSSRIIRRTVLRYDLPYATTLAGACAMGSGIEAMIKRGLNVRSLQDFHEESGKWTAVNSDGKSKPAHNMAAESLKKVGLQ